MEDTIKNIEEKYHFLLLLNHLYDSIEKEMKIYFGIKKLKYK